MDKGHVLGIEAFLVFLGWMLLLSLVWSDSSRAFHAQQAEWKKSRALETSIALSDALILSHHVQPWLGCAFFDDSLQRVRSYLVDESCLHSLASHSPPSLLVARVSVDDSLSQTTFFSRAIDANETCASVRRPIFIFPSSRVVFLDVISCA